MTTLKKKTVAKEIRLSVWVLPGSSFQADFARSALGAMGEAAAQYLNNSHKKNKASWTIEIS